MKLAVIGGSGLYQMDQLTDAVEKEQETPYGSPSAPIVSGRIGAQEVLFLPRHGRAHQIPPHQLNYRANICALKLLGATHLLSVSAVGSMKEAITPGDVVVVDQFLDFTKGRVRSFFEDGIVAHVGLADPVCAELSAAVGTAAEEAGARVHRGGSYVCIEGPQFSTRAESEMYRGFGVSAIGMTAMPEVRLAREAQLPYSLLALATDYDCWHASEEDVSVEAVIAVLKRNAAIARQTIVNLCAALPPADNSPARSALKFAVVTDQSQADPSAIERLGWLLQS